MGPLRKIKHMSIKNSLRLLIVMAFQGQTMAQFKLPQADLSDQRPTEFFISNATIVQTPNQIIRNAHMHVKDGKVIAVGSQIQIPKNIQAIDLQGAWIYPSFIDMFTSYGQPMQAQKSPGQYIESAPQYESKKPGPYIWNNAIKPEYDGVTVFSQNPKEAEEWRKNGFGWVISLPKDGVMRGTGALVALGEGTNAKLIAKAKCVQSFSFSKGTSNQSYPSSQMGSIALFRQTMLDATHYSKISTPIANLGLQAVNDNKNLPAIFETGQKYEILRAAKLGKEFNLPLILKGKGDEYQRLEEIKSTGYPLILSLQFPDLPDVEDPLDANLVSIAELKHWELAPYNAKLVAEKGIPFALIASDLKDPKQFLPALQKAVQCGLSKQDALAALTTRPATFLGVNQEIGRLNPGMNASFFTCSDDIFKTGSQILAHWVQGKKYMVQEIPSPQINGKYRIYLGNDSSHFLNIALSNGKTELNILWQDTIKMQTQGTVSQEKISFSVLLKNLDSTARLQFTGWKNGGNFQGWFTGGKYQESPWSARWISALNAKPKQDSTKAKMDSVGKIWYPFQAFGSTKIPGRQDFIIKNATVWTNEAEGKIEQSDVWVSGGKIKAVGKNLAVPAGILHIDGKNKHLTSGIIDEHSHIGISKGVNEGSSTTSPEVRIGDVIEADDINIYRHLAGGVTAVQQLHGSANAIGGQASHIKMRWGFAPDLLKIESAAPFNKFALGENVKQSNWGSANTIRYPQTRMGVEQLLYDAFYQAKNYQTEKAKAKSSKPEKPFKIDLKLEALGEILDHKRFISCHSYVQSEVNMLMHVADSMGFKINTFTHILEGYKVADKLKKHRAGASTFADWWAYKMEVMDAIPYNAAMMHKAGVMVAINSDDAEMARRLNQEAAKTIKYGGVSEEDAWKMVTLNPAKLLHLDAVMGSIKVGKDADLVIWSGNPLQVSVKVEKTFVDGILFYDAVDSETKDLENKSERQRIIQKMLKAKMGGQPTFTPQPKVQHLWHCDDLGEFIAE
jgi:imidazolonepropionase-like amidohydrolase